MNGDERQEQPGDAPATAAKPTPANPRHPPAWRRWLYRLLSLIVAPALFLLLLEAGLRLCGYGYPTDLFLATESDGQEAFVDNPHFGRRFFPPGLSRGLSPMVLPALKEDGTYRIFILGESAAMGYPDPSYHFGRILQTMLQDRYPETRFEVVNTGMVAINSHVILPIARECAKHQPDLIIVYMGNNEVVGPYGASGVLGSFNPSLNLIRASVGVKATRTGQLLANLAQLTSTSGPKAYSWGGMQMFAESKVPADDSRLPALYANFASNLQDICAAGRQTGAKILVCTVAANLKDSAPFASVPAPDLTSDQAAAWHKIYAEGVAWESARDHAQAVACYRRAAAVDDKFADLHYRLGRCLAALKKPEEAHRHFVLARDLDALRFRADSSINDSIRTTAKGRENEDIYLVDVERSFADASAQGIAGEDLFYEHVHLNFAGNYLLAGTVLDKMDRILPDSIRPRAERAPLLSVQECRERLPFTDWNLIQSLSQIVSMGLQPPFPNQLDHAERQERWRRQLEKLKARLDAARLEDAVAAYRRALERNPGDAVLHKDFAMLLWQQGNLAETAGQLQEAVKLVPHDHVQHCRLAEVLGQQGKLDEALARCREAVRLMPDDQQVHNVMGRLLTSAGKYDQAVASFQQALKLNPEWPLTHLNLGDALAGQKHYEQAAAAYEEALRLDPSYFSAHVQLGRLYGNLGRLDGALRHFRAALGIDPNQPQIHVELGVVLANSGDVDAAISELEEALRLKPGWPEATRNLHAIRLRKKQSQQTRQ